MLLYVNSIEKRTGMGNTGLKIPENKCLRVNTQVDMLKKLEKRMHEHVRHLSQDSTFNFFPNYFSKIEVVKLRVWLICECSLYSGVYGTFYMYSRQPMQSKDN